MPLSIRTAAILAALAGLMPVSAEAQAPQRSARTTAAQAVLQPLPAAALRPIAASPAELTLRGEFASQERPVFITAADALRISSFQLSFLNAVSVLPDASRLIVSINDQPVGEITLNASVDASTAVFRVPPGLVVPGFNAVRLTAVQRHRVDCTADATYELWTAIDPRASGFGGAGPAQVRRIIDLPALTGADGGSTRFRLRMNDGADARTIARSLRVAQALILLGWSQQPAVDFSSEPGVGPGIDVVIGTPAAVGDLQLPEASVIEPELGLTHFREPGSERSVLAFIGRTGAELDTIVTRLEALAGQRSLVGSPQGLRALANQFGRRAESGSTFRFGDLGFQTVTFDGALARSAFQIMLPGDFFPAPYGKARLRLAGGFASESDVDTRLEVRVNDRIVVGIPLERGSNELFTGRDIELPLEVFRPGMNDVSLEVRSQPRGQAACDPTVRQPRARLTVRDASLIEFGSLARVGQYPRLSPTLSHGLPYAGAGRPLALHVSTSDPAYLDAAGTIVARMVASAQRPIPVSIHFGRALRGGQGGLVVGPLSEAPEFVSAGRLTVVEAPPEPVRPVQIASATTTPSVLGLVERQVGAPASAVLGTGGPGETAGNAWLGSAASLPERALQHLNNAADGLRGFGLLPQRPRDVGAIDAITPNSVVITQWAALPPGVQQWQALLGPASEPEVWTAVSAASPAVLAETIERLSDPRVWHALDGSRAIFRAEQGRVQSFEPASYVYAATVEPSPGNWRLIAAGWLSLNLEVYLAAMALACLVLGLFTALALRVVRR